MRGGAAGDLEPLRSLGQDLFEDLPQEGGSAHLENGRGLPFFEGKAVLLFIFST